MLSPNKPLGRPNTAQTHEAKPDLANPGQASRIGNDKRPCRKFRLILFYVMLNWDHDDRSLRNPGRGIFSKFTTMTVHRCGRKKRTCFYMDLGPAPYTVVVVNNEPDLVWTWACSVQPLWS